MYEFTCKECGTVKRVKWKNLVGTFCSSSCASAYNRRNRDNGVDKSYPWKRASGNRRWVCRYNPQGCVCEDRKCSKCGHNPEVAEARTKAILKGLGL